MESILADSGPLKCWRGPQLLQTNCENRYKKCCAGGILAEEDIRPQKIRRGKVHGRVWREERGG